MSFARTKRSAVAGAASAYSNSIRAYRRIPRAPVHVLLQAAAAVDRRIFMGVEGGQDMPVRLSLTTPDEISVVVSRETACLPVSSAYNTQPKPPDMSGPLVVTRLPPRLLRVMYAARAQDHSLHRGCHTQRRPELERITRLVTGSHRERLRQTEVQHPHLARSGVTSRGGCQITMNELSRARFQRPRQSEQRSSALLDARARQPSLRSGPAPSWPGIPIHMTRPSHRRHCSRDR